MPLGPRKSGIPLPVEIPAPVNTRIRWARRKKDSIRSSAIAGRHVRPWSSKLQGSETLVCVGFITPVWLVRFPAQEHLLGTFDAERCQLLEDRARIPRWVNRAIDIRHRTLIDRGYLVPKLDCGLNDCSMRHRRVDQCAAEPSGDRLQQLVAPSWPS